MSNFKIYVERPSKGDKGEPGQTIIINAEDPTTKNLLFKFKNPTTGIYELGVPFYAPEASTLVQVAGGVQFVD